MQDDNQPTDDIDQRIIAAARDLFLHYGYDKTTMGDIADKAGIAKSTLYKRWRKKDDLFGALLWRESRVYIEDTFQRIEADPEGGTFSGLFKNAMLALANNTFLTTLLTSERHILGSYLQRVGLKDLYTRRIALTRTFLQLMQQAGNVRSDIDIDTLAFVLSSWQYGHLRLSSLLDDDDIPAFDDALHVMVNLLQAYAEPDERTDDRGPDSEAGKVVMRQFYAMIRQQLDELDQQTMR